MVARRRRYAGAMVLKLRLVCIALVGLLAIPASAQNRDTPYWASLRVERANLRVGPSESYRIAWVYVRRDVPLRVLRIKEGWRLVEDPDGAKGWIVGRFLSLERTAMVAGEGAAEMHAEASAGSRLRWRVEPGVIGRLGECEAGWCRFDVRGHVGYVAADRLWGAGEP